ncbi:MAG: hypothetical protein CMJ19_00910 [Phycisphaeraceae bacterium]|nr:hypothetical protein [Phycisphaeraceae bacterium]
MANLNGFNANDVEPNSSFEPIPAGKYLAAITASETKENKAGNGSYLEFTFCILEGACKGRMLWARLNLDNPNATAVKIARGDLSAICRAVDVMQPRDSVDLHNLPMVVSVKLKKRPDSGELSNEIRGFEPKQTGNTDNPASSQPQQTTTSGASAPWKR